MRSGRRRATLWQALGGAALAAILTAGGTAPAVADAPKQVPDVVGLQGDVDDTGHTGYLGPASFLAEGDAVSGWTSMMSGAYTGRVAYFSGTAGSQDWTVSVHPGLSVGTHPTSRFGDDTTPGVDSVALDVDGAGRGCNIITGSMNVRQAEWAEDGTPLAFAADFSVRCEGRTPATRGIVRYHSTVPWHMAASPGAGGVTTVVNSSDRITFPVTAYGVEPTVFGKASLVAEVRRGHPSWSLGEDTCSGRTLAPGQSCSVSVTFAPLEYDTGDFAAVQLPDGNTDPTGKTSSLAIQATGTAKQLTGQPVHVYAYGQSRSAVVTWSAPDQYPSGWTYNSSGSWRVYRVQGSTRTLVATTDGLRTFRAVVTGLTPGDEATFEVSGPWGAPMSLPVAATVPTRELVWAGDDVRGALDRTSITPSGMTHKFGAPAPYLRDLAVSATGNRYAGVFGEGGFTVGGEDYSSIALGDLTTGGSLPTPAALLQSDAWISDRAPVFSPDGKRLVFSRGATGDDPARTLKSLDLATGTLTAVDGGAKADDPAFTPDGKALIATDLSVTPSRLVRIDLVNGARRVLAGSGGASRPSVSPDGGTIAFAAQGGLWKVPVAGGTAAAVTGTAGALATDPAWSYDGSRLYFASGAAIKAVPAAGGAAVTVAETGSTESDAVAPTEIYSPLPSVATTLTMSVSKSTVAYGTAVTVSGTLGRGGSVVAGQTVALQFQAAGTTTWKSVASRTTGTSGTVSASVKPTGRGHFRLAYAGRTGTDTAAPLRSAVSASRFVQVNAVVTAKASTTSIRLGSTVKVTGKAVPAETGTRVSLQRWNGTAWVTVGSARQNSTGAVSLSVKPTARGSYSYRLFKNATTRIGAAASPTLRIRVR